ncbi:hypothetical protein NL676_038576 [Syzygium grande]|nr:hypothetical protein NL676_038576 [Syzygium grande]
MWLKDPKRRMIPKGIGSATLSPDAALNRLQGMWARGVRSVTSPFDLISEQGQLDPIKSKPGAIRNDNLG